MILWDYSFGYLQNLLVVIICLFLSLFTIIPALVYKPNPPFLEDLESDFGYHFSLLPAVFLGLGLQMNYSRLLYREGVSCLTISSPWSM